MRLYKVKSGIIIENKENYFLVNNMSWDDFFNDDKLLDKMKDISDSQNPISNGKDIIKSELQAPIQSQEIWAAGVTYFNSKLGRQEEAKESGGGQFYAHVYEAERPEIFFKALAHRTVGSGGFVRTRYDSSWDVPEPELTLAITSTGKIVGYTIGNDMSSRSIEGENPLYLPQAKSYDGSAALGPCIYVTDTHLPNETTIFLEIWRSNSVVFEGNVGIDQMKRKPEELVSFLYRECTFPYGSFLMTGTGIVPSHEFTLQPSDRILITIDPIGTLVNTVK